MSTGYFAPVSANPSSVAEPIHLPIPPPTAPRVAPEFPVRMFVSITFPSRPTKFLSRSPSSYQRLRVIRHSLYPSVTGPYFTIPLSWKNAFGAPYAPENIPTLSIAVLPLTVSGDLAPFFSLNALNIVSQSSIVSGMESPNSSIQSFLTIGPVEINSFSSLRTNGNI